MPVTVYPPHSAGASARADPVTVEDADTWRIGQLGSLQLLGQTNTVAEFASNQWGYVQTGGPSSQEEPNP